MNIKVPLKIYTTFSKDNQQEVESNSIHWDLLNKSKRSEIRLTTAWVDMIEEMVRKLKSRTYHVSLFLFKVAFVKLPSINISSNFLRLCKGV